VLRWAVEGCLRWQAEGLAPPKKVAEATLAYREDQDLLSAFLSDCCVVSPMVEVAAKDLYEAYKAWGEENGERSESQKKFGGRLVERGIKKIKRNGRIWRVGIGLATEESNAQDDGDYRDRFSMFSICEKDTYKKNPDLGPNGPDGPHTPEEGEIL